MKEVIAAWTATVRAGRKGFWSLGSLSWTGKSPNHERTQTQPFHFPGGGPGSFCDTYLASNENLNAMLPLSIQSRTRTYVYECELSVQCVPTSFGLLPRPSASKKACSQGSILSFSNIWWDGCKVPEPYFPEGLWRKHLWAFSFRPQRLEKGSASLEFKEEATQMFINRWMDKQGQSIHMN